MEVKGKFEEPVEHKPSMLRRMFSSKRKNKKNKVPSNIHSATSSQSEIHESYLDSQPSAGLLKPPAGTSRRSRKISFLKNDDYEMDNKYRGVAVIFNQKSFLSASQSYRLGSDADVKALRDHLIILGFKDKNIMIHEDLTYMKIFEVMLDLGKMNHKDNDCVMVVFLTHGRNNEMIWAQDVDFEIQKIISLLQPVKCPQLAGKPKIFILQACRGEDVETGVPLIMTDSAKVVKEQYILPNTSDFLMCYSCQPGFVSIRQETGTWFIQSLCEEIKNMDLLNDEFTHVLTRVNRKVALSYAGIQDGQLHKQCPAYTSTLLKRLYFRPKPS